MATYTTYTSIGQAEDVSEKITNLSPTDYPFISSIPRGRAMATTIEWQEDSLRRVTDNAAIEGADATDVTLSPTTMRRNYTQTLEKTFKISRRQDSVRTYGRTSETAYQKTKAFEEVKRDLEYACVGFTKNAVQGNATDTANKFGNVFGQDADSTAMVSTTISSGDSTAGAAMTEANLRTLHKNLYNLGANPKVLLVTPDNALTVANFALSSAAPAVAIRDRGNETELVNVVEVYRSPFGRLEVKQDRFLKQFIADEAVPPETQVDPATDGDSNPDQLGAALLYDPRMWSLDVLDNWAMTELAKTGDNRKFQVLGEFSLRHMNYSASGLLTDLNAA